MYWFDGKNWNDSIRNQTSTKTILFLTTIFFILPSISSAPSHIPNDLKTKSLLTNLETSTPSSSSTVLSQLTNDNNNSTLLPETSSIRNETLLPAAAASTRHTNFLLICSANSIDYWSTDCPIHHSISLLRLSRLASTVKHGFSGLTLWQPATRFDQNNPELIWFDAYENRFYHTGLAKRNDSGSDDNHDDPNRACQSNNILTIGTSEELSMKRNPFLSKVEKFVKLVVDNRQQLLIVSNLVQSRIDFYRLSMNQSVAASAQWIAHIDTIQPLDIGLDQQTMEIFWIENYTKICRFSYDKVEVLSSEDHANNLTTSKQCYSLNTTTTILSLTLNPTDRTILFADKRGIIRIRSYNNDNSWENSPLKFRAIYQSEMSIIGIHYATKPNPRLYINDNNEIQMFDMSMLNATFGTIAKQPDSTVMILSNVIFDLISFDIRENLRTDQPIDTTTILSTTTTTTTTLATTESTITTESTLPSSTLLIFDDDDDTNRTTQLPPNLPPHKTITALSDLVTSLPLLLALLSSVLVIVLCFLIWYKRRHFAKSLENRFVNCDNLACCCCCGNLWSRIGFSNNRYSIAVNRQSNVNGGGDDQDRLCPETDDSDCEWNDNRRRSRRNSDQCLSNQQQQYRKNILQNSNSFGTNSSDDIEDIFSDPLRRTTTTSRRLSFSSSSQQQQQPHHPPQPPPTRQCLACREPDICQDKGICMATYRVYQS